MAIEVQDRAHGCNSWKEGYAAMLVRGRLGQHIEIGKQIGIT